MAQLRVTNPVSRMVFQRTLSNEAAIMVTGVAPPTATLVEARFVPLALGQGSVTAWKRVGLLSGTLVFRGTVTVPAGWYRLDVRAKAGATLLAETRVNRVGVGEVFVVAGQSNMYGGFQRVPDALDDRVSCVDFQQDSLSEQLLPLQFSRISYGTSIGPSQPPHIWGALGDKLAWRLNVPVLFLGASLGGTDSFQWQQSAAGAFGTSVNSAVYRRLGAVLLHYIRRTGARAVLWHQGESDQLINTGTQAYFDNIRYVIEKSREQLGSAPLPWVVARASYIGGQTSAAIITAQNRLIGEVPNVFAGPATDSIVGPENRPDGIHFRDAGFVRFTNSWDQSLTDPFFATTVPFTPADESALITSGYTMPLTRRPGETIVAASVRSDAHEADSQYAAQVIRADNGAVVYESPASLDNPLLVTLPTGLPDGYYRLRTRSTRPATTGAPGEPFRVWQGASPTPPPPLLLRLPTRGGTADASLLRMGYRYESGSHGFFIMVRAEVPSEVRMERLDGGPFTDNDWRPALSSDQYPDYDQFADFNYLRFYPPLSFGMGGVAPGRYRLSVRRQGDTGPGLWFDTILLDGRVILYYPMESIGAIPPVITMTNQDAWPCVNTGSSGQSFGVVAEVTDGVMNSGNVFSARLSNASGSFSGETTIGSGSSSPIPVTLPASLSPGTGYRIRVVASSPTVASAASEPLVVCADAADLSLVMRVSSRITTVGQPVTLTLIVSNAGPQATNGVSAGSLLPDGLLFVDSASPSISALPGSITFNAGALAMGGRAWAAFRVRATRPGSFATAAQIMASSLSDPDSRPGSGTGDGQDDMALTDLRTAEGSGTLSLSPNPNQTPLPPVQSSQPPANPATADLSLNMTADRLTPGQNEVVRLTLTVSNRGGAAASNVAVQTRLPVGWQLTGTNGLTVNGQTVTGTIASVGAGRSASLELLVRVNEAGTVQAQIAGATPADADSTPGNGYTLGEDDEAGLYIRTR